MASNTTRLGLVKPTTLEPRAVGPLNSNADRIDETSGAFLINDGATIPDAQAFDGMIVKEKTSGKMWVLQKNVGGTFDARYIRYPWSATAYSDNVLVGNNAWAEYTFSTWSGASIASGGGPVNSDGSTLVSGRIIVPTKGIYSGFISAQWFQSSSGSRGVRTNFNNTTPGEDVNTTSLIATAGIASHTTHKSIFNELLPAGTSISANLWQNSGANLNVTYSIFVTLVCPVQT